MKTVMLVRNLNLHFLLAAILLLAAGPEGRCAQFWFELGDGSRIGHSFSLVDSHGHVESLSGQIFQDKFYEWRNSQTQESGWYPFDNFDDSDPSWYKTGPWRVQFIWLHGTFTPQNLTLNAETLYYLYDSDTNQYSQQPANVDSSFSSFSGYTDMQDGWPGSSVQTFGGDIKVFGKADFRSKARFDAPVRIAPAGDISMGVFTREPAF